MTPEHDPPHDAAVEGPWALAAAVFQALTGRPPRPFTATAASNPEPEVKGELAPIGIVEAVGALLSTNGLSSQQVQALRDKCREAGLAWPHFVPADARSGIGAAQLKAALDRVSDGLGIGVTSGGVRDGNQPKDAVDARLMAERPPHHGAVG